MEALGLGLEALGKSIKKFCYDLYCRDFLIYTGKASMDWFKFKNNDESWNIL